jgi:hypothetical protein
LPATWCDIEKNLGRKLTSAERAEYLMNGKISSRAEIAAAGKGTTEKPATKGQYQKVQSDRSKAWAKAEEDYNKDYEDVKALYDSAHNAKPENGMSADQVRKSKMEVAQAADKKASDKLFKAKQAAQDEYEDGITTLGGTAKHTDLTQGGNSGGGGKPNPKAAAASNQGGKGGKPAPRGDTSLIGKQAQVGGKTVTITGINPQTGKYQYK